MLYWDHMPLTGTLFQHSVAVDTFECPGEQETERDQLKMTIYLLPRLGKQRVAVSIRVEEGTYDDTGVLMECCNIGRLYIHVQQFLSSTKSPTTLSHLPRLFIRIDTWVDCLLSGCTDGGTGNYARR